MTGGAQCEGAPRSTGSMLASTGWSQLRPCAYRSQCMRNARPPPSHTTPQHCALPQASTALCPGPCALSLGPSLPCEARRIQSRTRARSSTGASARTCGTACSSDACISRRRWCGLPSRTRTRRRSAIARIDRRRWRGKSPGDSCLLTLDAGRLPLLRWHSSGSAAGKASYAQAFCFRRHGAGSARGGGQPGAGRYRSLRGS